jgi:hypothetical protein
MIEDEKLELRCVELCGVVGKMISNLVLRGLNLMPGGGGGGRDRGRNQCDDTLIPDNAINYQDRWYFKSRFVTLESESSCPELQLGGKWCLYTKEQLYRLAAQEVTMHFKQWGP